MRAMLRAAIAIGVSLLSTACLPVTSTSPIGSTAGYRPDPQLTGMWKTRPGESSTAYFTFFPQDDGSMKVVFVEPPASGDKGGWMNFDIRTAVLGPYTYMDARETEDAGKPGDPKLAHVPVLYRAGADGSLVLYLMDDDAAKSAVRAGKMPGTVEQGEYGDVTLTASPAALDAFLASPAGRAMFTKPFVALERLKP